MPWTLIVVQGASSEGAWYFVLCALLAGVVKMTFFVMYARAALSGGLGLPGSHSVALQVQIPPRENLPRHDESVGTRSG